MLKTTVSNERGGMLFVVAFAAVLMMVCGVTAYYMATTEISAAGARSEKAKALYLAEAGLQRALVGMTSGMDDGWDDELAGEDGQDGTEDDGILSFGPEVDCYASGGADLWTHYLGHYDVRIEDGRRPDQQSGSCNKVILGSTGVSIKNFKKRVEAEVEIFDLPQPPATVFMVGRYNETLFPDPDFSGQAFMIDGNDMNPDGTPGPGASVPGLASNGPATPIVDALRDNQKDQVKGTGYDETTSPITPSVQQTGTQVNLTQIAQKLKGMADNIIAPGTYSTFTGYGGPGDYQITVCDGDLHLSGQIEGRGVLVVTGDFKMSGQGRWDGYIIALNHARFVGGGTSFHLYGALMIGNSSGLDYVAEFEITGNSDLSYSTETIEKARTDVRTVSINHWRSLAAK